MFRYLTVGLTILAAPAWAGIELRFLEGAPKDRFEITNTSSCDLTNQVLTIDMSNSNAGLIFDVTGQGAGVEVFQPFEVVAGGSSLSSLPDIKDGDAIMTLAVLSLSVGEVIAFTIDVDDTAGNREITVTGSELAGTTLQIGNSAPTIIGDKNRATAVNSACAT